MSAVSCPPHPRLTCRADDGGVKTVLLTAILALTLAAPAAAEIPRLDVRTAKQIRDEPKVPARLTVGKRTHRIGIEVRGQGTQLHSKKPYGFEARRRIRLLGMPAERDWVLNAGFRDPSLLRDALAHRAARELGLASSRTRHVELWLNGRPRGLYLLMERAELSRRRVQGEALLELTEPIALDRGDDSFPSATGYAVRHVEPDEAGERESRRARAAVAALEASLGGPGWRAHLDERSAVDYVLLTELLKNQDAFHRSTFVHQRASGRLALGPVWDFDLSAGNVTYPPAAPPEGWLLGDRAWAGALLADPGFRVRAGRALARAAGARVRPRPAAHRRPRSARPARACTAQLRALADPRQAAVPRPAGARLPSLGRRRG